MASWLDAFRRRRRASEPAPPGSPEYVGAALLRLECAVAEGMVRAGEPRAAGAAPALNLWGRPVQELCVASAPARVARASGMALAGLRATAFVGAEELLAVAEALRACAARHLPLVVHADLGVGGAEALHAVAGTGCLPIVAASGQEALDWSLLARWLTERALVPVLVASAHDAIESLDRPDDARLAEFLGAPDGPVESPSEAQRILLGAERPRLLPWFDLDRPVASGGPRARSGEAARERAEHAYFWTALPTFLREGAAALDSVTGRCLDSAPAYELEDAEVVLVGEGATVQAARAVASQLRRQGRPRVGVLGISVLRPFPAEEVARQLGAKRPVAVIELSSGGSEAPLLRELAAAVGGGEGWVSARCGPGGPDPQALAALCERLRRGEAPPHVQLDPISEPRPTGHPRREVLVQSASRAHPELSRSELPPVKAPPADPRGGRSVALVARAEALPSDAVLRLATLVGEELGGFVRGWALSPAAGARGARLRGAPESFADPGPRAPVSLLWVAGEELADLPCAPSGVAEGGSLLLASAAPPESLWARLPAGWRRSIRDRELRLLAGPVPFDEGLEALRALLRGEETASVREVPWRDLPEIAARERRLPRIVRRWSRIRETHDSLPRFWGEVVQPQEDGAADDWPDPLSAVGVVPALASALAPEPAASALPVLDPEACTACGRCWSACPDSAIGVTALGAEALLGAASRSAGTEGRAADALRRAHKHWAGRLASELGPEARTLDGAALRGAWEWLRGRLTIPDEEEAAYAEAAAATVAALARLEPVVSESLWREAEAETKGSGALLILALDPRACVGCGVCVAECPESALRLEERTPQRVLELRERWQAWEELPDTPGEILARAADRAEPGPLAATLLSRHCGQAQVGGCGGEPGSGERLATRLVVAFAEAQGQRHDAAWVDTLRKQRSQLEAQVREQLGSALAEPTLEILGEAVAGVRRGRAGLGDLARRLDALGSPARFDRQAVLRLTRAAGELEQIAQRLDQGEEGLGRARFGVVVAGDPTAEWAARFPRHPFFAPLTVAATAEGAELAHGIAHTVAAQHVAVVRALRAAAVEAEAPPDRSERLEALRRLRWSDLERSERLGCPPLLLLGDEETLLERGFEWVTRLLDTDLSVKVVLLDGRGRIEPAPEPALLAMVHRRAFVLAASLAHPDHLARGLGDAFARPGPAFVHLHAPSPSRHGFRADALLERARLAVEGRAHILLRYDPEAEGVFGLRASLEGNPQLDADWGEIHFADWAAGEERFAGHFTPVEEGRGVPLAEWLALSESERARREPPTLECAGRRLAVGPALARGSAERRAVWETLRELTGVAGPFAGRIRAELREELEAAHREELAAQEREGEAKLARARAAADDEALRRLTDRLLTLSGFAPAPGKTGDSGEAGS